MTDNEIIHTWSLCQLEDSQVCETCPLGQSYPWCDEVLQKETLDLINRQKAEIEKLKKENEILSQNADTAFQDGLNEAQELYAEQIKAEIKAEAYKECVGKVKENSNKMDLVCSGALVRRDYTITEQKLDTLLKELAGENNSPYIDKQN